MVTRKNTTKPRNNHLKLSGKDIAFHIVNYTVFGLFTLLCIFPFYYLFINTISSNEAVRLGEVKLLPVGLHFNNYLDVLKIQGLPMAAIISVLRTVLGTIWTVFGSALCGYIFTKNDMFMRKILYRFIIITMYFGAGLVPWYLNMRNLGLTNNFWAYVIPGLVSPYNMILVKTFIEGVPTALEESAEIEGAGYFTCFTRIVLPVITPILATIAIFSAVGNWNSYTDTLVLMTDENLYTLQFLLYRYQAKVQSLALMARSAQDASSIADLATKQTPQSIQMTVSMVVVFPILMVYPFFQRFFVKGVMIGAVKG